MTAAEVYELTTVGGMTVFKQVLVACEELGPYCLIGGLAVNCYVEPLYTLDADLVFISSALPELTKKLTGHGFDVKTHEHTLNVIAPGSELRIQFTKDERYQDFLPRRIEAMVLGEKVKVACLRDVVQGKLWAYSDLKRRFSKRKKDELDLIRLAEAYPELKSMYPAELQQLCGLGL
jgi:hypothetical protein